MPDSDIPAGARYQVVEADPAADPPRLYAAVYDTWRTDNVPEATYPLDFWGKGPVRGSLAAPRDPPEFIMELVRSVRDPSQAPVGPGDGNAFARNQCAAMNANHAIAMDMKAKGLV